MNLNEIQERIGHLVVYEHIEDPGDGTEWVKKRKRGIIVWAGTDSDEKEEVQIRYDLNKFDNVSPKSIIRVFQKGTPMRDVIANLALLLVFLFSGCGSESSDTKVDDLNKSYEVNFTNRSGVPMYDIQILYGISGTRTEAVMNAGETFSVTSESYNIVVFDGMTGNTEFGELFSTHLPVSYADAPVENRSIYMMSTLFYLEIKNNSTGNVDAIFKNYSLPDEELWIVSDPIAPGERAFCGCFRKADMPAFKIMAMADDLIWNVSSYSLAVDVNGNSHLLITLVQ